MNGPFDPWDEFTNLNAMLPPAEPCMRATRLPGIACSYLARTVEGAPSFLIALDKSRVRVPRAPIALEHLEVVYETHCVVQECDGDASEGDFALIRCLASDYRLHEYFVRSIYPVVTALPANATVLDVAAAVHSVVELFRALGAPPREPITGLWGELFLIHASNAPEMLVEAWRQLGHEKFDFSGGGVRLEVKTTESAERVHSFALEQLIDSDSEPTVIASLLVRPASSGLAIPDMLRSISRKLVHRHDLVSRLWNTVARTLGIELEHVSEVRFEERHALREMRFVRARNVPSVVAPNPPEVFDVRFKSNLTHVEAMLPADLLALGGLLTALNSPDSDSAGKSRSG